MSVENFKSLFQYNSKLAGYIGVERERFITDAEGNIVPKAMEVISHIKKNYLGYARWPSDDYEPGLGSLVAPELSACQLETRTVPTMLPFLKQQLEGWDKQLAKAFAEVGYRQLHTEVAPVDIPLEVYPDPSGRYQQIVKHLSKRELLAGCRVTGTHIHVGMPDHETALRTYNNLCSQVNNLCEMGNGSFGERLAIYRQMAPDYRPMPYESWQDFYDVACRKGFADDPRKCWTLIRISVHGTIEFRMFGATDSVDRIVRWAEYCHELCTNVHAL